MNRAEILAMIDERIDAAITEGKTCSTIAERNERSRFLANQEASAIRIELAARAAEAPIPAYVAITLSPTSRKSAIRTAALYELGENGYRIQVGGGFELTKNGSASRQTIPTAGFEKMSREDPEFKALLESGDLVIEPMTEAEARPIEELVRRFRQAADSTRQLSSQPHPGSNSLRFRG